MRLKLDGRDVISKHRLMARRLIEGQWSASQEAGEVVTEAVKADLQSKILRPRESEGLLASEITYDVRRMLGGNLFIGIGDILRMRKRVPYWRLIDEGGPISVKAVPGFFINTQGVRVPFERRAPGQKSDDIFIYAPLHGWTSPHKYSTLGEAAQQASVMFVRKPIDPKHYFDSGNDQAQPRVFMIFKRYFLQAFR